MTKPVITVFMAAYNAAHYIDESIKSILNQTFLDFELLIVNDGSTDKTTEIINSYTDPRIRLVHNDQNMGLTYTRNVALREAKGKYLAILDSDDIAIENRLELQYNFLQEHPNIALVGGHALVIDQKGIIIEEEKLIVPVDIQEIKMTLLFVNTFVNSTVMYKMSVLRKLNGYLDFAPAEDYELFTRVSDQYNLANLDEILVKYRKHDSNTSTDKHEIAKRNILEIKRKQLGYLGLYEDGMAETLFSLLMWDYKSYKISDYLRLFTELKSANQKLKKYPIAAFEKILFQRWFDVLYIKKAKMNALPLLLNKSLFKWSYVSSKQLRRAFKLSLKGVGRWSY